MDRILIKVLFSHHMKRLRKAGKNLSQDSLCPCGESKQLFPDYKPELLRLEPP